jgi:large subunit ribosomal protein L38e
MPREFTNLKQFLSFVKDRKDVRYVKVKLAKKANEPSKFKVRSSKYLYTLVINDAKKAQKIQQSLPEGVKKIVITKKVPSGARQILKKKGAKKAAKKN